MPRRYAGHMNGQQYLANVSKLEVHDLDNEKSSCQINEIISDGHDKAYRLLRAAQRDHYDICPWCLSKPKRRQVFVP